MALNQVHDAIRKVRREIRAVVRTAVFFQTPGDVDSRVTLAQGQLHIGISFIVAQQDVEARLLLLDEVILKRQRLFVVGYDDIVNVDCFAHQRIGLRVLDPSLAKVRTDPTAKIIRLANIDDLAFSVLVQVHSGRRRQGAYFGGKVHGG